MSQRNYHPAGLSEPQTPAAPLCLWLASAPQGITVWNDKESQTRESGKRQTRENKSDFPAYFTVFVRTSSDVVTS